jgi:hypothetical protein
MIKECGVIFCIQNININKNRWKTEVENILAGRQRRSHIFIEKAIQFY